MDDTGFTIHDVPAPAPPRPLFRDMEPAPDLPLDALGELRKPVEAIHLRTQAPLALCAQSALAAATLAAQAHRDVELPGAGKRPLTEIFVTIAASGERKSATDRIALAAVYQVEQKWRDDHAAEMASYLNDHAAWKAAREKAVKGKGSRGEIRTALDAIGPEPRKPADPMLLISDPSPEAIVLHLRDNRPFGGVFTAEGAILIGGNSFNEETRMRTGGLFNVLWDGEAIRRARVLTGNAFLTGRRVTAHVMMQRAVADKLMGDAMLDDIGLLARTLLVDPPSTIGTRMFREPPPECRAILDDYNAKLKTLLLRSPVVRADAPDALDPPAMRLDDDAQRLFIAFYNAVESDLREGRALHPIRALGAKLAEHAGRLAAVLALYADPDAMDVPRAAMACGIQLAKHYAAEALRMKQAAIVAPDLRLAARLLDWWRARPDPICHLAEIYQRGIYAVGDAATARRIVAILDDHGHVTRLQAGTEVDGKPRKEAWRLVQ